MAALPDGLTIRTIDEEEYPDFARAVTMQFGEDLADDALPAYAALSELDRTFACVDGDGIVGTAANISFTMGMPGAPPAPCAGLTAVGVNPTRRRRGILTALMRRAFDDAIERAEPFAALYASEATIYGRFGYGPAVPMAAYTIRAPYGQLRTPPDSVEDVRLVDADEVVRLLPSIYDRAQQDTPGLLVGPARRWETLLHDPSSWRDGHTARYHAVIEGRGAAIYRLKSGWRDGAPDGTVRLSELVACDADAYASLWHFLLTMDLMPNVRASGRPTDEPLQHALVDPARLRATGDEPMYLRFVDLPRALTARGYRTAGSVVLDVRDGFLPQNEGRWRLEASPDGSSCERTDASPDLALDTSVLATAFLGGVRLRSLVDARRIDVHRHEAVALLDALLHTDRAPWNAEMF